MKCRSRSSTARPEQLPQANESSVAIGGHMEGCRIGFDAGGS